MKQKDYTIHAILLVFIIACLPSLLMYVPANRITKQITDERGLTSVQFIQDGKEWGLDYLTKNELDSLKKELNK